VSCLHGTPVREYFESCGAHHYLPNQRRLTHNQTRLCAIVNPVTL
jgi:hypothetical protein